MLAQAGIGLVIVAMLSWGIGDFLIQKSSRKLGDWETLFAITAFGALILVPFVYHRLAAVFATPRDLYILLGSGAFLTVAAIFQIESFKRGKMAVVEPMLPSEIPAASILAFIILGDLITTQQLWLIVALIIGLFLISFRGNVFSRRFLAEKGVFLGFFGACLMGVADFFMGWGSRTTDPVMANFVINIVMAVFSGSYLLASGRAAKTWHDIKANRGLALMMAISDNIAWLAYAFAMSIIPIAVATGLSESSCIIAVLLGLFVNKERLQRHQKAGLAIALVSAIALAFVTSS
jgi:drug/metabolite transporter (DMT)-like permease